MSAKGHGHGLWLWLYPIWRKLNGFKTIQSGDKLMKEYTSVITPI